MNDDRLNHCIEVFARGVAFTRSMVRPYIASQVGAAWWLRDGKPSLSRGRNDEWICLEDVEPVVIARTARARAARGHLVNAVSPGNLAASGLGAKYRGLGYRLWRTEALMTRSTDDRSTIKGAAVVRPVDSADMAARLAKAAGGRVIRTEGFGTESNPVRCHVAILDGELVGWCRTISIKKASWCSSMFVAPAHRRRGIGRSLVSSMLQSDHAAGLTTSILVASHAGAKLYAATGYETIGTIRVFTSAKARWK